MPLDPFFTSQGKPKQCYSAEDEAECARLHALPFNRGEDSVYHQIKRRMREGERVSNGEFLFVKGIDQKIIWKKRREWAENRRRYTKSNIVSGGFSNLHNV